MEPPPEGTFMVPLLAVERPLVETQAYCLPDPAPIGLLHVKEMLEPTSRVTLTGRLEYE